MCKYCEQNESIFYDKNSEGIREVVIEQDGTLSICSNDYDRTDMKKSMAMGFSFRESSLMAQYSVSVKINFCPMCGKALKQIEKDSEEQGLLMHLPVRVGSHIWVNGVLGCGKAEEYKVTKVDYHSTSEKNEFYIEAFLVNGTMSNFIGFYDKEIGKTVFLTPEAAKYVLEDTAEKVKLSEIYGKVMAEYSQEGVMLNSLFFDFYVEPTKKIELLEVYKEIVHDVNGDYVERVENPVYDATGEFVIGGKIVEFDDGSMDDLYSGNMKDFLESFNDNNDGLIRFLELNTDDNDDNIIINSIPLDFIA